MPSACGATATRRSGSARSSWCAGDARAGRALFDRYFGPISRFFASKVAGDHDDLVQETFAACMAGRERLRDPERFRSYLSSVEIERALEIPAATVRTRLRRARRLLAAALEQLPAPAEARGRAIEQLEAWAAATREAAGGDAEP